MSITYSILFNSFLSGEIGMSDELDSFGDSIFNGYLPSLWRKLCPDTQKPLGTMLHCMNVLIAMVLCHVMWRGGINLLVV